MLTAVIALSLFSCASSKITTAEEYFSLGMAYFDLGKAAADANTRLKYFQESEKWLNRARMIDKTQTASEYNIGRIAFETGRYADAAASFEKILKRDPDNVLALRAASYTRIKTGDTELAEAHYKKLLTLVPENSDDGYNYALVLYAIEKYDAAEQVLSRFQFSLLDNNDALLLFARTQKAQNKIEAAESYSRWLVNNDDKKVRCEYAELLESHEFYARALDEYRGVLEKLTDTDSDPKKSDVRFYVARLLLIADSESDEGMTELETARKEGFADIELLEKLADDTRISETHAGAVRAVIKTLQDEIDKSSKTDESADSSADEQENDGDTAADTAGTSV
jgi:tetratricopeptide (TPR) repeat protein